jgi:hypothetical protein
MGAMGCDREGCEHVMCNRYNREVGYICWECFDEFIDYLVAVNYHVARLEGNSPLYYLKIFMKHPKGFKFPPKDTAIKCAEETAEQLFPLPKW